MDLLVDAGGGAGAQDPPAQDAGLQLQVGGLDLPALVVQRDQRGRRPAPGIGQGGGQPVAAAGPAGAGGDGDLGVDDADGDPAEQRQPGPVGQAANQRQLAVGLAAPQQLRAAGGDATGEGGGGEVAVVFFQAEDGIRDKLVTGVQTCALPI